MLKHATTWRCRSLAVWGSGVRVPSAPPKIIALVRWYFSSTRAILVPGLHMTVCQIRARSVPRGGQWFPTCGVDQGVESGCDDLITFAGCVLVDHRCPGR